MHASPDSLNIAERLLSAAMGITDRLAVVIICCHEDYTIPSFDYSAFSITNRYYTSDEFDAIVSVLRDKGVIVVSMFSEDQFIAWVMSGGHRALDREYLLVWSTGASNPGLGAKALVPSFCQLKGLEVVGPDAHCATLARHKFHFSMVLDSCGIDVPRTWLFHPAQGWLYDEQPPTGSRVLIKPGHEAASIGIDTDSVARVDGSFPGLVKRRCAALRQSIVVQEFIDGEEFQVPLVVGRESWSMGAVGVSVTEGKPMGESVMSYDDKNSGRTYFYAPSAEQQQLVETLVTQSRRAAMALALRDVARVDFRVDGTGVPYLIDVSTTPYISRDSAFGYAYDRMGGDASQLPLVLVASACERLGWIAAAHCSVP